MKNIAFIGTGVMGANMVRNLLKGGFNVRVYNRSKEKALPLANEGAIVCDTIKECVENQDIIITIIGFPKDVEDVYFADHGVLANVKKGTYVIDMTTSSPKLAQRIYEKAKEMDIYALDAPVSGGDVGAKNATLAIMVGGDEIAFNACKPAFEAMGTNIVYEGAAGAGQHVKMANQIVVASNTVGICEAIAYTKAMGIDPHRMIQTIHSGAAGSWQVSNNGPKMADDDYSPGFYIKHFVKDMRIALEEAKTAGVQLGILQDIYNMYIKLEENGMGELGSQAVIKNYGK